MKVDLERDEFENQLINVEEEKKLIESKLNRLEERRKKYEEEICNAKTKCSKERDFMKQSDNDLYEKLQKSEEKFLKLK